MDATIGWHYCSLNTFLRIVESQQFHLGNAFFMNDRNEVREFLEKALSELDKLTDPATRNLKCTQSNFAQCLANKLRHPPLDHIYVGCFSTKADDLSQWRGYADDGRGVAIKCNLCSVEQASNAHELLDRFSVVYDETRQVHEAARIIEEHRNKLERKQAHSAFRRLALVAYVQLSHAAPKFKAKAFESEREIRLLLRPRSPSTRSHGFLDLRSMETAGLGVSFKKRDGKLIPYIAIPFPRSAIEEVMLGPKFGDAADEMVLRLYLAQMGVGAEVKRSSAPYR